MRAILLTTAFLAGAALMSLEMASFRLVQPEFGSDVVVWGSLISVFLGGLAVGAVLGGRLADRRPRLWKLGLLLLVAGAVTLLLPLYSDAVMEWLYPGEGAPLPAEWTSSSTIPRSTGPLFPLAATTNASSDASTGDLPAANSGHGPAGGETPLFYQPPDLRWQTLGAGILLFGLPSILLGMVSPYAARLFVHALPSMGTSLGQVYGISTIGSIIGTVGTAFYLVAWMGTKWLLSANGLLLLLLGAFLVLANSLIRQAATKPPAAEK